MASRSFHLHRCSGVVFKDPLLSSLGPVPSWAIRLLLLLHVCASGCGRSWGRTSHYITGAMLRTGVRSDAVVVCYGQVTLSVSM